MRKLASGVVKSLLYLVVLLGAVSMVLPFLWMLSTAFKEAEQILALPPIWIPRPITLDNFVQLVRAVPFGRFFLNSVINSVVLTGSQLFLCAMTGYAFAKLPFPGKGWLFMLIVSSMMVPGAVTLIPTFLVVVYLRWVDTWWGLLVPRMATAFGVFFMRQFFMNLPDDYIDAARIDGASEFVTFWKIMIPLCKPALATLGTFSFIGTWNDFVWPLVIVNSDRLKTLPLGFAVLGGQYGFHFEWTMAAAVLTILPVILIFMILQEYVIRGITLTGLK
jgi:multiple sugar transport system permease protein